MPLPIDRGPTNKAGGKTASVRHGSDRGSSPSRRLSLIALAIFVLAVSLPAPQTTAEGNVGDRFFPQTGFTVPARFMSYWTGHGGLPVFGYPITAPQMENGYLAQYFERNRFEYHPEHTGTPYEVLLGLLGSDAAAGKYFPKRSAFVTNQGHIYYNATGFSLEGSFLLYWQSHGGLALFGYPVSDEIQERSATDGKTYTVQYFQRNRFELHPENRPPFDVLLGLLGRDYVARNKISASAPARDPFPGWNAFPPGGYPPAPAGPFPGSPNAALGIVVDMYYKDHKSVLDAAQGAGFTWIKQQVQWKDIEGAPGSDAWAELDSIVTDTSARGLHIMLSIVKAPDWATGGAGGFPTDPAYLGNFMRALAGHYKGRVAAYEIWNEQNLFSESLDLDPSHYAVLLKAGYLGVKAADPGAIVVSGALTPTGIYDKNRAMEDTWYLDQLYRWNNGEIRQYYDVLGSHPYGYNNPPETMWPDMPSGASGFVNHGQFYYRRVEQQREVMLKYGDDAKQVWLTEYGWCSDARPGGYDECAQTTQAQQADYTLRAIAQARSLYPWVGVMFLWNLNFSTFQDPASAESLFSILNPDWTPRPVYTAIKGLEK
ncbi:MAG: cellulase family glycosylhydrolase [Chloroflexia bacterium]